MLYLETDLEGKRMEFGYAKKLLKGHGFDMGGNWEYHSGFFDGIMHRERENGETIYARLPFRVLEGELDHSDALIEFQKPFVIKHVVNIGLDADGSSLLDASTNVFRYDYFYIICFTIFNQTINCQHPWEVLWIKRNA